MAVNLDGVFRCMQADLGEAHANIHLRSAYVPATPERHDVHS